jgi:hypothetical protein
VHINAELNVTEILGPFIRLQNPVNALHSPHTLFVDLFYYYLSFLFHSRNSVVGIATGYGLVDQWVGVRVSEGARILLLHVVQTSSKVHPISSPMGAGGSFPGSKGKKSRSQSFYFLHPLALYPFQWSSHFLQLLYLNTIFQHPVA